MEKILYTVYKITNKFNGKIYIGTHKTKNLDDGYMGSGKYLKRAIEKNGIDNFYKEILFVFDNPDDMFNKEAELVNKDFLAEENTYNLKVGGFGGWDYANSKMNGNVRSRIGKKVASNPEFRKKVSESVKKYIKKNPVDVKKKMDIYRKGLALSENKGFTKGNIHSEETKKKMSNIRKGKNTGDKNPAFGKVWVCNDSLETNKRIDKSELEHYISLGWRKSRVQSYFKK